MQYIYPILFTVAALVAVAIPYEMVMEKRRKRKIEEFFGERQ